MEQINRIELRGNVGSIRLRSVNGKQVANISLVTDYLYKGKTGEPVIETTWHNITAWEGKGMPDFTRIAKGTKLQLTGRIRTQRYTDSEGVERTSYEVVVNQMLIVDDNSSLQF